MNEFNRYGEPPQEEKIDYKVLFFKIYSYWYFFLITIFIAVLIAFLFNKYTPSVYKVKSTVLIKDDKSRMDPQALLGISMMSSSQNIQNEIGILKSYTISNKTVKKLDLKVSYFIEENFITRELYDESPFVVIPEIEYLQPANIKFLVTVLSTNEFKIEAEGESIDLYNFSTYKNIPKGADRVFINGIYTFGQDIEGENFRFKIILNEDLLDTEIKNKKYIFIFNNIDNLTKTFSNSIEIEAINRDASILEISVKGNNSKKIIDFLNTLIETYLERSLEKKNLIASSTIGFIDAQLGDIADSLSVAEASLQDFRMASSVMNIDFQAQQVFDQMKQFETERAALVVQSKYYNHLKRYIEQSRDNIDEIIVPSSMGIDDPMITQLISELVKLHSEKADLLIKTK